MNLDKKIKMLLLIVNRLGIEINYETINKYSSKFDSITSEYHLKIWNKKEYEDKETGEIKTKWYCNDKEFSRQDLVVKYLMAIKNNRGEHNGQ